jgi:hypothetical protein
MLCRGLPFTLHSIGRILIHSLCSYVYFGAACTARCIEINLKTNFTCTKMYTLQAVGSLLHVSARHGCHHQEVHSEANVTPCKLYARSYCRGNPSCALSTKWPTLPWGIMQLTLAVVSWGKVIRLDAYDQYWSTAATINADEMQLYLVRESNIIFPVVFRMVGGVGTFDLGLL